MRAWIVVVMLVLAGACAKKKSEDKAPASTEQSAPAQPVPATEPPKEGAATGAGGSDVMGGSADTKAQMPADDGGEAKARMPSDDGGEDGKPMPADDGGEAAKKACTQTADCGANHDCCNGFCFKHGTAKHAIECKLPSGKL